MASASENPAEYIQHHLTNLTFGQHPNGSWGFAHTAEEAAAMCFNAIHVDSMFWSIFCRISSTALRRSRPATLAWTTILRWTFSLLM